MDLRKNLYDFLVSLATVADGPAVADSITKKFKKFIPGLLFSFVLFSLFSLFSHIYWTDQIPSGKGTLEDQVHQLLESGTIPAESNTMKIIRCFRTDVVAPAHRKLRRIFPQNIPVATIPGSWLVRVVVNQKNILVQHSRRGALPPFSFFLCVISC